MRIHTYTHSGLRSTFFAPPKSIAHSICITLIKCTYSICIRGSPSVYLLDSFWCIFVVSSDMFNVTSRTLVPHAFPIKRTHNQPKHIRGGREHRLGRVILYMFVAVWFIESWSVRFLCDKIGWSILGKISHENISEKSFVATCVTDRST